MSSARALELRTTPEASEEASGAEETNEALYRVDENPNEDGLIQSTDLTNAASLLTHDTLKYSLLGPSLLKAGQESVDQSKVCAQCAGKAVRHVQRSFVLSADPGCAGFGYYLQCVQGLEVF
jgi:hypothetical protein